MFGLLLLQHSNDNYHVIAVTCLIYCMGAYRHTQNVSRVWCTHEYQQLIVSCCDASTHGIPTGHV